MIIVKYMCVCLLSYCLTLSRREKNGSFGQNYGRVMPRKEECEDSYLSFIYIYGSFITLSNSSDVASENDRIDDFQVKGC